VIVEIVEIHCDVCSDWDSDFNAGPGSFFKRWGWTRKKGSPEWQEKEGRRFMHVCPKCSKKNPGGDG
jgi:hypothetical protein